MVTWARATHFGATRQASNALQKSDNPKIIDDLIGIKAQLGALDVIVRKTLQAQIVAACAVARRLRASPFHWSEFMALNWAPLRRPKAADKCDALRHVFRWVCGPTKEGQQKASFYYRAVGPLFERGLGDAELRKKIEKHGLRRLADRHSKHREADAITRFPQKRGKRWILPVEVYFDREPNDFPELEEHMAFTLKGKVMKLGHRLQLLAYKFE